MDGKLPREESKCRGILAKLILVKASQSDQTSRVEDEELDQLLRVSSSQEWETPTNFTK